MGIARVTTKGQVTIPVEIRTILKIRAGDSLLFEEDGRGGGGFQVIHRRSLTDLAGSLASMEPFPGKQEIRDAVGQARGQEIVAVDEED